jgi:hypothetical protein
LQDGLQLLIGLVGDTQGQREQNPVHDCPEQRGSGQQTQRVRDTRGQDAAEHPGQEQERPANQPRYGEQRAKDEERHRRDAERLHAAHLGESHQDPHGVLPRRGLPRTDRDHDEACDGRRPGQPARALGAGDWQLEIRPEAASPRTERVAERETDAGDESLEREGSRQQAGRQGEREEQRADEEADGRKVSDDGS